MGDIARLRLAYEGGEGPASVVAKIPRLESRAFGELVGVYERESYFYEELSEEVPVALPRLYYGDFDRDPAAERQGRVKALANRIPQRLLPRVTQVALWMAGRKKRRYILLLEDLGDATPGDQLAGTDPERCALVLRSIAKAHAALWGSPALENRYWLEPFAGDSRVRQSMFLDGLKTFRERHAELFDEDFERTVAWVIENGVETIERMQREAPDTLVHGDLRLDNLVFRGDEPVFFDWQAIRRGPAAFGRGLVPLRGEREPDAGRRGRAAPYLPRSARRARGEQLPVRSVRAALPDGAAHNRADAGSADDPGCGRGRGPRRGDGAGRGSGGCGRDWRRSTWTGCSTPSRRYRGQRELASQACWVTRRGRPRRWSRARARR